MSQIKLLSFLFAILLGVFMFIYGGMDDSPGGQLLGVVAVIFGTIGVVRSMKKTS